MDIPDTGAVFTLGKSYLSENHQSYFFIKNDPIKKVIAGDNQSAVICESGRLFVWGENQYGQLSAGSKEVITKPSCVKEIKNLGYKVRNIAFGEAFSVILTENNKVFFNGKSIFAINDTYGGKFRNLDNIGHCVIRHNYEIIDFHKRCFDDQGNLDDLVDVVAGRTHFVVLTNSGKLYCYGFFEATKVKQRQKQQIETRRISEHLVVRIAKCGSTFVVFVTDCNGIYILGKLNGIEYTRATKLNTSDVRDTVYSIYVSQKNEIFLISSLGDVYKSTNDAEIQFERIILFNQNDNIRKFCSGNDFVCVLTDKNKFLTTFNEKASAKNTVAIRPPHELRKFQDLRILDIAAGLHHILLFAVSRISPSISLDITSSDANENIPIHKLPESDASVKSGENPNQQRRLSHQNTSEFKNIVSPRPILTKETLEAIQADAQTTNANVPIDEPVAVKTQIQSDLVENSINVSKDISVPSPPVVTETNERSEQIENIENVIKLEKVEAERKSEEIIRLENHQETGAIKKIVGIEKLQKTEQIEQFEKPKEFGQVEKIEKFEKPELKSQLSEEIIEIVKQAQESQDDYLKLSDQVGADMDFVSKSVSNIGDNLMNDVKSFATAGEEKLNDLAKETEKTIKEVPKNVIDYVKTSVGLEKEEKDNVLGANMDEKVNAMKELPRQLTDPMIPNEMSGNPPMQNAEPNVDEKVKHNNKLNRAMAEDDSNETMLEDFKDDAVDNEVKFINNGVDVSSTSNIIQAMKDEINEMSNDVKNKSDELTMKYDDIINDEMNATKEAVSTKMFQMKNAGKDVMKEATTASADLMTKIIPLKRDLDEVDLEADGDTEQTTASIKSVSTPAKNQLEMDETVDTMETVKEATTPKEEGRVKRFFNEIKNNCKTADTVVEMEESAMQQVQQIKSQSLNDIMGDNKTSKVCTIL